MIKRGQLPGGDSPLTVAVLKKITRTLPYILFLGNL